ncbi:DUF3137 domain-containing protein [Cloacibacillus sp. An23]|uniref:DUF3137 domain-containing protein n=1 Tax=Cloacibacillus sp. An23 TaxID=1965591 RepID=UPI000B36656E|nr:DUF3137 domain-containing protein [Cloacibacillus sp. An23]OUO92764.1 hypothetical protein B5F39_09820 [Cloacibacillus sp. An23]
MTDAESARGAEITVEELEKMRESAKRRLCAVFAAGAAAFPLFAWLVYSGRDSGEGALKTLLTTAGAAAALSGCAAGALWYVIGRRAYDRFVESFKSKYVLGVVGAMDGFSGLEYDSRSGFTWDELRGAAVVDCGQEKYFKSEDRLTGFYNGARFRISDVTARKMTRRGKKNELVEVFGGQLLCFSRTGGKESAGLVQVFRKEFFRDMGGPRAEHRIRTENARFNDEFNIYADDEHNAYYILTPPMMEKISFFAESAGGQVSLSFSGETLYVAVRRRGMFSPVIDVPVERQAAEIRGDVAIIAKAGDVFLGVPERDA